MSQKTPRKKPKWLTSECEELVRKKQVDCPLFLEKDRDFKMSICPNVFECEEDLSDWENGRFNWDRKYQI